MAVITNGYDWWETTSTTGTTPTMVTMVRMERVLDDFTESMRELKRDAEEAYSFKRQLAIESLEIASRLEPKPLVPPHYVPRVFRPVRQPPGRFAFYQGEGW